MRFTFFLIIIYFIFISSSCGDTENRRNTMDRISTEKITNYISTIQQQFVPDRRVKRLDVIVTKKEGIWILTGETNLPEAKDSLLRLLIANNISFRDSITLWPDNGLGKKTYALTRHSVANLRSERGHSQELATQALLGTPLLVLKQEKEWYFVQCPDGYLAWIHGGELSLKTAEEMDEWKKSDRVIFIADYDHSYQENKMIHPLGDLVKGDLIQRLESSGKAHTKVAYPDGRVAYVKTKQLENFDEYLAANTLTFDRTLAIAHTQTGKPYLWGGTSPKAMDCSGFTKTLYWQQGLIIPRDASQQVHAGEGVTYDDKLIGLEKGDFLFFGRFREDGSEKITHVGLYIGNGRFIHSGSDNGANKEESLLPDTPDYAPHRRKSLLRARRMNIGGDGVVELAKHSWYF